MGDGKEGPELEGQVILRMPEAPAGRLREALRMEATNLKERLSLKLDVDQRTGTLYFDEFMLHCKSCPVCHEQLVDLPCIIESHKSIDKKNIYKTADICQMILCMEKEEPEEKARPTKAHGTKIDRKYLFPHGVTPPLKSVRKRRFRKVLRKKQYSDQPELEKELKMLLRSDYEATKIHWELVDDQEDPNRDGAGGSTGKCNVLMEGSKTIEALEGTSGMIAEEHIFGEALSDSDADDEDGDQGGLDDIDDESRTSADLNDSKSHMSDSMASFSQSQTPLDGSKSNYTTSFHDLFRVGSPASSSEPPTPSTARSVSPTAKSSQRPFGDIGKPSGSSQSHSSRDDLMAQLAELQSQLSDIRTRRQQQEADLPDNVALRKRLEPVINKLMKDEQEKEEQIRRIESMLNEL